MLPIISAPHEVLSQVAKPVANIDDSIKRLIKEMEETLAHTSDPEGVGLAAPQIGKSLQIFIMKPTPKSPTTVCINPVLYEDTSSLEKPTEQKSKKKKKENTKLEGCLSLPRIWGIVRRLPSVKLTYLDEHGTKHEKEFSGFPATIVQHEYDHLQGILFPKRVLEQQNQLYKSTKDEKGEDVFEELTI